jgi:hypothetical protein
MSHAAKYQGSSSQFSPITIFDLLYPLRQWLAAIEIQEPKVARFVCKMIPTRCPFERNIRLWGRTLFHIPPLCKLNPVYDELVELRLRALSFLADNCGEDVSEYCC